MNPNLYVDLFYFIYPCFISLFCFISSVQQILAFLPDSYLSIIILLFLFIVFCTYDVIIHKYGPDNQPSTSLQCSFDLVYMCVCILTFNM